MKKKKRSVISSELCFVMMQLKDIGSLEDDSAIVCLKRILTCKKYFCCLNFFVSDNSLIFFFKLTDVKSWPPER